MTTERNTDATTDAQTTLPTSMSTPAAPWQRLGGIIAAPRATFAALLRDPRAHLLEPLAVYVVAVVVAAAPDLYRLGALIGTATDIALRRMLGVVVDAVRAEVAVVAVAAAIVGGVVVAVDRDRPMGVAFGRGATATTYLLVPLALLKLLSMVVMAAGFDAWWLPHRAVDALPAIVVKNRVDVVRFAVKCTIAFLPGLLVLLAWLATHKRAATPVRAYVARSGFAVVVVVVVAGVVGAGVFVGQNAARLAPSLAGAVFPALPLAQLSPDGATKKGSRVDVARLAQRKETRAVVVDFWASWCAPCRRSVPELSLIARDYEAKGVRVVGVNREPGDVDAAVAAWTALAPSFPSLIDDRGLGERLGLTSLPSSYVVDHAGVIRHVHLGYTEPAVLRRELDALLMEAP